METWDCEKHSFKDRKTRNDCCVFLINQGRGTSVKDTARRSTVIAWNLWEQDLPFSPGNTSHGIVLYCILLHGIAWYCVVLHIAQHCISRIAQYFCGIACYCMALCGANLFYPRQHLIKSVWNKHLGKMSILNLSETSVLGTGEKIDSKVLNYARLPIGLRKCLTMIEQDRL